MNRLEHLLIILAEECGEVIQDAAKSLRFGIHEGRDIDCTNGQRLRKEFNQLLAVADMLEEEGVDLSFDYDVQEQKREKVEEYLKYSKVCGTYSDIEGIQSIPEEDLEEFYITLQALIKKKDDRKRKQIIEESK